MHCHCIVSFSLKLNQKIYNKVELFRCNSTCIHSVSVILFLLSNSYQELGITDKLYFAKLV